MSTKKTERNDEMKMMSRNGHRLSEIARKYNISRERARQIVGNTGCITPWYADVIKNGDDKTNEELSSITGLGIESIRRYRSGNRHAIEPGSTSVHRGTLAEAVVSDAMKELGIQHKLMPSQHPFDILVNDGTTIDVKSAHTIFSPPSLIGRTKSPLYNFNMRTNKKSKARADFYILVVFNDEVDMFIVPSIAIPDTDSIRMAWPTMRPEIGKYQQYHNRWDLLRG